VGEYGRLAQRYPHREQPHESIVLGRSREPDATAVLNVEVTLPVRDVLPELDVLRSVLGARTLYIDVGTEFDLWFRRAVAAEADAAEPVEQPWGMREFVLRLCDGHQLVVTGPA
jgi:hypothetical protein